MTHAVILAGGWGERLWPMSTRERPKQLLSLTGGESLVSETVRRVAPVASMSESLVMTSASLEARLVSELGSVPEERVIGEPVGRNTAPAIALAARLLSASDPDAVMVVLPADHVVKDASAFVSAVRTAVSAAESARALVTLGIVPTRPETEYGYILSGGSAGVDGVLEVESFEEKPDLDTARRYLEGGGCFWNSGMFVWRADVFLAEVREHLPEVASALERVTSLPGEDRFRSDLQRFYESVPSISVDYGVMEKAERVLVVPADFGWDDVGAWPALARVWGVDADGNTLRGDAVAVDSRGSIVFSEEGTVAVLGMDGVVVVRTEDATLVCPRDRAGDVRLVVEALRARGGRRGGSNGA